ncbi:Cof-type HAD-IIB family hydrolase [Bacillus sonorensis]|uniref:Cof-like hydrolase n=2 Tax=Bacillus sonorensis TaxID=119858 RepID=M5PDG7_9BACI|nr:MULTISPECIES: Cof-type HAD-IIB family hydrolase [Bacillus]TWK83534.1 Phosphatase YwpJ [Bacillus paralicheniformis]ASB91398.1 Putative phosphatase YcsE [Bacillus sonorensis]EME73767.1 Cof-like hydrolase [Bacillus sonorensis L12]MBG9914712.1 hypothetical protein [Bacillus sonorensis]MCF7615992.1 Cof-type HAD-IIB family hydrolase [Bacillus sonorensis]
MKLIAIDLDGTLLSEDGTISKANLDTLSEAQKQGHRLAICSGRSHHDILQILRKYNIKASIISGNGGVIYDKALIKRLVLPDHTVKEMIDLAEHEQLFCELYTNEGIIMKQSGRSMLEEELAEQSKTLDSAVKAVYSREITNLFNQHPIRFIADFRKTDFSALQIYKIGAISYQKTKRDRFMAKLEGRHDISITSGSLGTVEIGHPETNKGHGVSFLADYFKIPLEHTVAIGDNFNDIPMFKLAGISIAMENAHDDVKNCAMHVTDAQNQNGVAKAIKEYVLNC